MSREAKRDREAFVSPNITQLWAIWCGQCSADRCSLDATHQVTVQRTWRSNPHVWTYCDGHASSHLAFWVGAHLHYLQIEPYGTIQQALPLDWPEPVTSD